MRCLFLCVRIVVITMAFLVLSHAETTHLEKSYDFDQIFEMSSERQALRASCGPVALARCLHILQKDAPLNEILSKFSTKSSNGVLLGELVDVSKKYVPKSVGCQIPQESLSQINSPAIRLVDDGRHCLVFEDFDKHQDWVTVWNPANFASNRISYAQLKERWNGEAILFANDGSLYVWLGSATVVFWGIGLFLVADIWRNHRKLRQRWNRCLKTLKIQQFE